ncbi:uncharacterized protein NESG_01913 [Nematocida ausubeli]|uniref:Uncharacterized protein n=1 Tax=Nematocida ausubeli (strain ATCC PRA-371 / ERTm2) TaxID=1913371 RepID=A0A086J1A6_NEMA1|nr:uncharacterized protein NESG_01913 [Nematocida ausubeli]KFG25924.1 hypothetical protein NESG_01913 [Nematocida ausubeli]
MKLDIVFWSKRRPAKKLSAEGTRKRSGRENKMGPAVYLLIQILILCEVWGRIPLNELISIQKKTFTFIDEEKENALVISPDSALNLLRDEIADNIWVIHNKRFLSSEIQIEYYIKVEPSEYNDPIYTHTRDHSLDRVHLILPYEGDLLKYKRGYFNTLLELFPSLHGYVSTWSGRRDSFFSFINSNHVENYKYKILASLLLLTEGVNVPLEIDESENRTELVLRQAGGEGEHFRLNMNVVVKTGKNAEYLDVFERVFQKRAIGVINFFIENREKRVFKEEESCSEQALYGNFKKSEFVNSPDFLIETYIYHCMERAEEMDLFIQTVLDLLSEYIKQEEIGSEKGLIERCATCLLTCIRYKEANLEDNQGKQALIMQAKGVLYKYFALEKKNPNNSDCIARAQTKVPFYNDCKKQWVNLLYLKPNADVFPVQKKMDSLMSNCLGALGLCLPARTALVVGDELKYIESFTDYGETALLGLFCWAFYDSERKMYIVDHMESASEELKSFFRKHRHMYGIVSKRVHNEWNKVVGGLYNPNIQYIRDDRNQLMPGLINMLYVIKEITGVGETEKIDKFKKCLDLIDNEKSIGEVRMLYWEYLNNINDSTKKIDVLEEEIRGMIDVKKLDRNKTLKDILEPVENKPASSIKINKSMDEEKEKKMDINLLYEIYSIQNQNLKNELKENINRYLTALVKKIALNERFSVDLLTGYKQNLKEGLSDMFGFLKLFYIPYNEKSKNIRFSHCYCYEFDVFPDHVDKTLKVKWKYEFKFYSRYSMANKPNSYTITILNSYITRSMVIDKLKIENIRHSNSNEQTRPVFCHESWRRNIDALLLDPRMHNTQDKRRILWVMTICAMDLNLDSSHPLVRLANNIMGSIPSMDKNDNDPIFMFLGLTTAGEYYPSITVDINAYEKPNRFTFILEKVLGLEESTKIVSQLTYANILTSIIINFRRACWSSIYYLDLELFARRLSSRTQRFFFINILTLNGTTMRYITRIIQAMQGEERVHPVVEYEGHSTQFLLWIIWLANNYKYDNWCTIVKSCYELIDTTEQKEINFPIYCLKWGRDINLPILLKEIKHIVCDENSEKSVERFELICGLIEYVL